MTDFTTPYPISVDWMPLNSSENMIQAPFIAHRKQYATLEQALSLVSSSPGKYLNDKNQSGRFVAGAPADLIVIDTAGKWRNVCYTWAGGQLVYRSR